MMETLFVTRPNSVRPKMYIAVSQLDNREIEFDWLGIHAGFADAIRRILLYEVATMAVEKVEVRKNTSSVEDEVLARRLRLLPLKADPRLFDFHHPSDERYCDRDCLEFELKIKCPENPENTFGLNYSVYSKDIKWIPIEGQASRFKEACFGPIEPGILIAELKPGQEIEAKLIAVKGVRRDDMRFSAIKTATYRLLPYVEMEQNVEGELVQQLQECFSTGVIGIKEIDGVKSAFVNDARLNACSWDPNKIEKLKDELVTGRVADHYIFTVESVGCFTPDELVREAIKELKRKCSSSLTNLKQLLTPL